MESRPSAPEKRKVRGMFKRLTVRLKRKGDKHKEEESETTRPHDESEVPVHDSKDQAVEVNAEHLDPEPCKGSAGAEAGKGKVCSEDVSDRKVGKRSKVEHLLKRTKKYHHSRAKQHTTANDRPKGKEEDSDANVEAIEEQKQTKKKKKHKDHKNKREKKKEEKRRSCIPSIGQSDTDLITRVDGSEAQAPAPDNVPAMAARITARTPTVAHGIGRPAGGVIRPYSCPPQRYHGELSNYGLRAIEGAILDIGRSLAPELQSRTPPMTLSAFVEGEQAAATAVTELQLGKPNLPSFDLPPPPSPPHHSQAVIMSSSSEALDLAKGRWPPCTGRVRSLAGLSQHELAALASTRAPFQSPLPPTSPNKGICLASASSCPVGAASLDETDLETPLPLLPLFTASTTMSTTPLEKAKGRPGRRHSAKQARRRTLGAPVLTFMDFALSSGPVKVPPLPMALSGSHCASTTAVSSHKRKGGADRGDIVPGHRTTPDLGDARSPEPKHARLEDAEQSQLELEQTREKSDTEAGFAAVPECEADEGLRIQVEERPPKRKPSIRPDEIKLLQQEQEQHLQATGDETAIHIADGPLLSTSGQNPIVDRPLNCIALGQASSRTQEEKDGGAAFEHEEEEQDEVKDQDEEEAKKGPQTVSQAAMQRPKKGRRRRRNRGKAKRGQGSRLAYR